MRRRTLGTLSFAVTLLLSAATGLSGGVASAGGTCAGNCALGELELTGPPPVASPSVGAGTTSSLTFTLSNDTASGGSSKKLESAELSAPAGFAIQSATLAPSRTSDPPTAHVSVDTGTTPPTYTLVLDDLDLRPGASVSAALSVTASCAATSGTWGLTVDPARATPTSKKGFIVDPSSALSVGVTGQCTLKFGTDPANAVVDQDITSQGFTPSGSPVEVEALDANGGPLGGVGVALSAELGAASLGGATSAATAPSGFASFSPLTLGETGYYYLEASAPHFVSASSGLFLITNSATTCTSNCSGSTSDGPASVDVNVSNPGSGDLLSVVVGGFSYSCPDSFSPTGYYRTVTAPVGVDLWQGNGSLDPSQRSEEVTITIPGDLLQPYPPFPFFPFLGFLDVCYASTQPFPGSTLVSSAESIPGYAGSTYVGLLRDCPFYPFYTGVNAAPCVLSRYWWQGNAVITFLGAPGDFWGSA